MYIYIYTTYQITYIPCLVLHTIAYCNMCTTCNIRYYATPIFVTYGLVYRSILIYSVLCSLSNIFSLKLNFIWSVYLSEVETENFNSLPKFDKINTFSGNKIIHQTYYL